MLRNIPGLWSIWELEFDGVSGFLAAIGDGLEPDDPEEWGAGGTAGGSLCTAGLKNK